MPLPEVSGLFGNQIFLFPAADLTVVVSEHLPEDAARLQTSEAAAAAREHAKVISSCFGRSTVLPFRFGTTFQDDDAMRRSVRSNQRHFMANVERLRGMAEMHLKVLVDDVCPAREAGKAPVSPAGQQYLASLRESASRQRERQSRARALSIQMHRMFLPIAEEVTCKRTDSGKMLLDIAHLVDKKTIERYQNKYSSASLQLKDCAMHLSGPWPPYHFRPARPACPRVTVSFALLTFQANASSRARGVCFGYQLAGFPGAGSGAGFAIFLCRRLSTAPRLRRFSPALSIRCQNAAK